MLWRRLMRILGLEDVNEVKESPDDICHHKGVDPGDKFCRECGDPLHPFNWAAPPSLAIFQPDDDGPEHKEQWEDVCFPS